MLLSPARRTDPVLTSAVRKMASDIGPQTFLRQQRAIIGRIDSRPGLGAIRAPTLILWGDADGITTEAHQQEIAAGIAGSRRIDLPGCGHLLTLETPDAVNAHLSAWLAEP